MVKFYVLAKQTLAMDAQLKKFVKRKSKIKMEFPANLVKVMIPFQLLIIVTNCAMIYMDLLYVLLVCLLMVVKMRQSAWSVLLVTITTIAHPIQIVKFIVMGIGI